MLRLKLRRSPVYFTHESVLITMVSQCGRVCAGEQTHVCGYQLLVFFCGSQVSQYEMPNSQETPSTFAPEKKRKFSEPKERF